MPGTSRGSMPRWQEGWTGCDCCRRPAWPFSRQSVRHDLDQVLNLEIRKGLGYFLHGVNGESIPGTPGAFGHPGAGGSVGWADPARGLALGFAKTRLVSPRDRWTATDVRISVKVREVLGLS